jgi:hypothetical protein
MSNHSTEKRVWTLAGGILSIINLAVYGLVYYFEPFGPFSDRLILNLQTILTSAFAAIILTVVIGFFQAGEPPQRIWASFAGAVWCWTVGEVIWAGYNLTVVEVPDFSVADVFWFFGYIFLTASILRQYQLIYVDQVNSLRSTAAMVWVFSIMMTAMILSFVGTQNILVDFPGVFYPIADFFVASAALALVIIFRSGSLAYPWLSLFAFVVADSLYVWATMSGVYNYEMTRSVINMLVDGSYLLAYSILGWGGFQQFLLMKFGVSVPATQEE